jgi:hypothetical protein
MEPVRMSTYNMPLLWRKDMQISILGVRPVAVLADASYGTNHLLGALILGEGIA